MVGKSILFEAKAFLCWDKFPQLTIKLVPIQDEVAFFYPPSQDASSIVLFYNPNIKDFTRPLFLLFHEAGHFLQWEKYAAQNKEAEFWQCINLDKGTDKVHFERAAWDFARNLILEFCIKIEVTKADFMKNFDSYSESCISSYE